MADIGLAGLTNVVCQVGIAQQAVAAALNHPGSGADVAAATRVWQQRCALVLDQLAGYPCVRPHGGWSLLIDTRSMGLTPGEASGRLFTRAQVAATPMDGWGPSGAPVPAPGLRQRTRRTAHRPARPLRHRTELTTPQHQRHAQRPGRAQSRCWLILLAGSGGGA